MRRLGIDGKPIESHRVAHGFEARGGRAVGLQNLVAEVVQAKAAARPALVRLVPGVDDDLHRAADHDAAADPFLDRLLRFVQQPDAARA